MGIPDGFHQGALAERDLSSDKGREKRIFGQNQWVGHFAMGNPTCSHQVIMDDSFFAFARSLQRQRGGENAIFCQNQHVRLFRDIVSHIKVFWLIRYGNSRWFSPRRSRGLVLCICALFGACLSKMVKYRSHVTQYATQP